MSAPAMICRRLIIALVCVSAWLPFISRSDEPRHEPGRHLDSMLQAARLIPIASLAKKGITIPSDEICVPENCVEWLGAEIIRSGRVNIGFRRADDCPEWFWLFEPLVINCEPKEGHARLLRLLTKMGFRSIDPGGRYPHAFRRDAAKPNDQGVEEIVRLSGSIEPAEATLRINFEWVVRSKQGVDASRPTYSQLCKAMPMLEPRTPVAHPIPPALIDLLRNQKVDQLWLDGNHPHNFATMIQLAKNRDGSLPITLARIAAVMQAEGLQEEDVGVNNGKLGGKLQYARSTLQGDRVASCCVTVFEAPTYMKIVMRLQP